MTFTEAAAQVLRLVGKPLHYKEITDVAIEKDLLSHVGKSPEVTMGARLAAMVKKNEKGNPLVRVKPGVFGLRDWDKATVEKGLADRTPALKLIAANEAAEAEAGPSEVDEPAEEDSEAESGVPEPPKSDVESALTSSVAGGLEVDEQPMDEDVKTRLELAASATDIFEPEDDDDEPILGGDDDDDEADERADAGGKRRRRRRRRSGGRSDDEGLPSYTVSDAPSGDEELAQLVQKAGRDRGERRERGERNERGERGERSDRNERGDRNERSERGDRNEAASRGRGRPSRDYDEAASDDEAPESSPDVVYALLKFQQRHSPIGVKQLQDMAQKRDWELGSVGGVVAACRADNVRRQARGLRPRFRLSNNRLALTEWGVDAELGKLEAQLEELSERYEAATRRQLQRKLRDLPQRSAADFLTAVLEGMGFNELQAVKRQGAHPAEIHLSAKSPAAWGGIQTAIVMRRDARDVGRERVIDLRGALHHYGPAHAGLLVTAGQVLSGAREESAHATASPISFLDGSALAQACIQAGIGVEHRRLTLSALDQDVFEALR